MKQCKDCLFYDELFDRIYQSDILVEGEEEREIHFCTQYHSGDGIPKHIVEDKVECEYKPEAL